MKHILVVDDLDIKRGALVDAIRGLTGSSVSIIEAENRFEAEQVFITHQPELIFMDGTFPIRPGQGNQAGAGLRYVQDLVQLGYMGIIVAFSGDYDLQKDMLAAGCQYELSPGRPMMLATLEEILQRAGIL